LRTAASGKAARCNSRPPAPSFLRIPARHVILASIGTDGDVFPYVALGATLRARGHRVTLAAAETYRPLADRSGFAFRPLCTAADNDALIGHPDFWHPLKGPYVGARWGVRFLPAQYDLFARLAADGDAVFVANPGLVAARVARDKLGFPMATLIPQPWMIPSATAPPVMPAGLTLPRWAPRFAGRLYFRGIDAIGAALMGRELNALRAAVGLPPVRRVFQWWLSPDLVIGLFPDWYGPPQPDWPPQTRLTGFPVGDRQPLADDLLAYCRSDDPPIAVTFGTGMRHGQRIFRAAVDACRMTGRRALLLTRHAGQLPTPLPPTIRHVPFAPFRALFPHCAAIVHHGGVGTVAQALAAARPQLILPIAYDQKDNAIRVERLGAGTWMRARSATGPRIARALTALTRNTPPDRLQQLATKFEIPADPLDQAATLVEGLANTT
jgi:UDP:flavonoid glycosyltransferase YjiC (YdhE family)